MKLIYICLALVLPTLATAEEIISPHEFEQMSRGKTLYFSRGGQLFGIEQFYRRHRSTWQFADGECDDGVWYPRDGLICFQYTKNPEPQCWHFLKTEDGFVARAEGSTADQDLHLERVDQEPLDCKGPDVGV